MSITPVAMSDRAGSEIDYDDPRTEELWCSAQREVVADYLAAHSVARGELGEWPAWHVAPYVAVWAVESATSPGWIGCWVISGDLPTDHVAAAGLPEPQHPRHALRSIAERWLKTATRGEAATEGADLRVLLESRAELLLRWAADDSVWDDE